MSISAREDRHGTYTRSLLAAAITMLGTTTGSLAQDTPTGLPAESKTVRPDAPHLTERSRASTPDRGTPELVAFDSGRWKLHSGSPTRHLGRLAYAGTAVLEDASLADGILEVDLAVTGERSYPGVVFRMTDGQNYERAYLRPHRAGLYPDAVQYTPVFRGVAGWQLYHGPGFTTGCSIPRDRWFSLRIEVTGGQARVHVGNGTEPTLRISNLQHSPRSGAIGIMGPTNGTAYFSNFRYTPTAPHPSADHREGEPQQQPSWELSRTFAASDLDPSTYPRFYTVFGAAWEPVPTLPSGLIDVSRHRTWRAGTADTVMARVALHATAPRTLVLPFGYSDTVQVFWNGRPVFHGNSAYRSRDPSFLGIVGLHDRLLLPLETGRNELLLMLTESFGGWGFRTRLPEGMADTPRDHAQLVKAWETPPVFLTPESVLHDPGRDVLYVSSFDRAYQQRPGRGYLSVLTLDGEVESHRWVTGLDAPTGMALDGATLWVLERRTLTAIDTRDGTIVERLAIPTPDFPNDLTIDEEGVLYLTDTSPSSHRDSRILRCREGEFDVFRGDAEIERANGLTAHGDDLLVGNSGDGSLKAIDLVSRRVRRITSLGAGLIDGIKVDQDGTYLVSHWSGRIYRVAPQGEVQEIANLAPRGLNAADFEFVPEHRLLVVPTFVGNRVQAYRVVGTR